MDFSPKKNKQEKNIRKNEIQEHNKNKLLDDESRTYDSDLFNTKRIEVEETTPMIDKKYKELNTYVKHFEKIDCSKKNILFPISLILNVVSLLIALYMFNITGITTLILLGIFQVILWNKFQNLNLSFDNAAIEKENVLEVLKAFFKTTKISYVYYMDNIFLLLGFIMLVGTEIVNIFTLFTQNPINYGIFNNAIFPIGIILFILGIIGSILNSNSKNIIVFSKILYLLLGIAYIFSTIFLFVKYNVFYINCINLILLSLFSIIISYFND